MRKIFSCALVAAMIFCFNGSVFAGENNTGVGFENASTINVRVDTRMMIYNATAPDENLALSGDGFKEAGTVYVEPEINILDNATSPFGALPARPQDMAEASRTPDENVSESENIERRASWIYLDNRFDVYNQITSYNCGPAAVQAALNYLVGSTPSQSVIAAGCNTTSGGTYLADMETYINGQQSVRTYISKYNADSTTMKDSLYSGVVSYDAPSIIG